VANLSIGRNLLKTYYEVYPVPSAAKMFNILEKFIPSLILLDVEMPKMSGYEAIKILKSDSRFAHIPVIFLTAKRNEENEMEGFDLGAVDYITKPFSAPLLLRRISSLLLIVQQNYDLLASRATLQDYADNLEIKVSEKTAEIFSLQNAVLATVSDLVESCDEFTGKHISRTQLFLQALIEDIVSAKGEYADEINTWNNRRCGFSKKNNQRNKKTCIFTSCFDICGNSS